MKQALILLIVLMHIPTAFAQDWYEFREREPRWISPENKTAAVGQGGQENQGAKGHPYETIRAGESLVLGQIEGAGVIHRIWITISDRDPVMLRSLRLDIFWDGAERPAVSVPFGDFFGIGLGQLVPFENALFSSPEGRSFNAWVPMPFKASARLVLTNESDRDLARVFYDINYTLGAEHGEDMLYFHAYWHRQRPTTLGEAFPILPRVAGRGRYLGTNVGVVTDSAYGETWWGEGEVKIYLNDDRAYPTLVGTGTEDYIGTGWGQGPFVHRYQGSPIADPETQQWAFYRYHLPDPIFFDESCEVMLQQMGGAPKAEVLSMLEAGAALQPVTLDAGDRERFIKLLEASPPLALDSDDLPDGWVNFYRQDDVSATVYLYLDRPSTDLAPLASVEQRTAGMKNEAPDL